MSVNKVILIGNLGKDPDVRYLDAGVAVAVFPLATTEKGYTNKNGVQIPERTEWHNIVMWRGLAETAEKYLHKGDKLYLEGKIRTRTYEDQAHITRYITEIFVDTIELLGSSQKRPLPPDPQAPAPNQTQPIVEQFTPERSDNTDDLPF